MVRRSSRLQTKGTIDYTPVGSRSRPSPLAPKKGAASKVLDFDVQEKVKKEAAEKKVVEKEREKGKEKEVEKEEEKPKNPQLALLEQLGAPVQGKNVSGRKWKQPKKGSTSHIMNKQESTSWTEKQKRRSERRDLQATIQESKKRKREEHEARVEEIKRKREIKKQNELKGMQFQVIRDTTKINQMSRKQKKLLMKMDTTNM